MSTFTNSMSGLARILSEYGLGVFMTLLGLSIVVWIGRLSLKNPVDIMSKILQDADIVREALKVELDRREQVITQEREIIEAQDIKITQLTAQIVELERELDMLLNRENLDG